MDNVYVDVWIISMSKFPTFPPRKNNDGEMIPAAIIDKKGSKEHKKPKTHEGGSLKEKASRPKKKPSLWSTKSLFSGFSSKTDPNTGSSMVLGFNADSHRREAVLNKKRNIRNIDPAVLNDV